jgi:hypothetical protein
MKGNNSLMEWLVKLIFFLMLLPFFVCLVVQALTNTLNALMIFLLAIVPWLIGFAVLIAIVAGMSAGLGLRRRLPPRNRNYLPPAGMAPPIRRPRGRGRGDD